MSSVKIDTLLAKNSDLYTVPTNQQNDQSRLTVTLDQNIIDDLNNQILAKQSILENSIDVPILSVINDIFVNIIDLFYEFMMWVRNPTQVSLFNVLFTGYRPVSLLIVCVLIYYIVYAIVQAIVHADVHAGVQAGVQAGVHAGVQANM